MPCRYLRTLDFTVSEMESEKPLEGFEWKYDMT